jgi:hypothetical protein
MINFEHTNVMNIENAFRGMRNPLNSWDKTDSYYDKTQYILGTQDLQLAKNLIIGGTEHRKFLRQIFVSVDITAPLYWWKQFDTYKINTTSNSCSTMHKIHSKEFGTDDFSYEDMSKGGLECLSYMIETLNLARKFYLKKKNKEYWFDMIKLLPESYNQKRTITMNYENILNMCAQRKGHKLKEWESFREWAKTLPYSKELIFLKES